VGISSAEQPSQDFDPIHLPGPFKIMEDGGECPDF